MTKHTNDSDTNNRKNYQQQHQTQGWDVYFQIQSSFALVKAGYVQFRLNFGHQLNNFYIISDYLINVLL